MTLRDLQEPEGELLWSVFRDAGLVTRLARAPGGWRSLSEHEMTKLDLTDVETRAVLALQQLVGRSYPALPKVYVGSPAAVGKVYENRLGGLDYEVVLAVALDRTLRILGEIEVARGGHMGAALTAADVLRPLIRAGAHAFVLVHNHPSGDPSPSPEDIAMTYALETAAEIVHLTMLDHLIVGGRGGGVVSLFERGLLRPNETLTHAASTLDSE